MLQRSSIALRIRRPHGSNINRNISRTTSIFCHEGGGGSTSNGESEAQRPQTRRAGLDEVWAERMIAAREEPVLVTPAEARMARKFRQENRGGASGGYVRLLTSDVRSEAALSRRRGGRLIMTFRPSDSARAPPRCRPSEPLICPSISVPVGRRAGCCGDVRRNRVRTSGGQGGWEGNLRTGIVRRGSVRARRRTGQTSRQVCSPERPTAWLAVRAHPL